MTLADATAFPYGLRVLVVDDDPTWLNILEKMLITTCSLASVALQILRERRNKFDIVISDVNMIDLDGFKLLEHIGLEMDLPVIMMSIDGEISRVRKGVQHGACDYLLKPVRMKELRNIWQHVYRKKMHEVKEIEGYDSCDDLQIFRNGCEGLEERGLFMRADSDTMRKRKDVDNADQDSSDGTTVKKARVVWSVDLHQKFVNAVNQIGFDQVGPKKILDLMNVPGLTRENVASHLLKYRLYLSRLQKQNEERIMGATKVTCASQQSLLSAVDEILHLKEIHAFPMASPAHRHMDTALGVAMSRLMDEFLLLRVWDASQLEGRHGLRVAVERLSVSVAPGGSGVWLDFPTSGSISTGELSVSTTDELHASGMSISSWPDTPTTFMDVDSIAGIHEIHAEDLHLIHPASLPLLHEIALRVIRAGYSKEFLQTFAMAPCHVLDRFLSIVQLDRPSFATNRVNFEDAEWWATEDMVKRWILATKLIGKAIVVMRMQLMAQECGAFDRFKDAYFMAIAKQRILVLLKFADGFTSTRSPEKLIYVLELYEALSSSAPALLPLFTGQHAELISRQVPDVLAKLARALRAAIGGLITKIRTDCSQEASATIGVGVHSLARHAMTCVDLLAPHRATLDLILANGGGEDERGAPAGGADGVTSFGSLASELIAGLERNLDEKSALACAVGSPSSRHLFLANNTGFVLSRAGDAGVASLLGDDEWAARRRSLLEQHAASYIQATWGPVVACLETAVAGGRGKPAKALAKFNAAFEKTHGGQVCREVWDPALRAAMRMAVKEMVVPAYSAFLHKHPRLGKSVRYTADDLAESLSELFEGDAADDGKS